MRRSPAVPGAWATASGTAPASKHSGTQLDRLVDLVPGVLLPVLLILNPLVVGCFAALDRVHFLYLAALDLAALGGLACYGAGRMLDRRSLRRASLVWLTVIPLQLGLLEYAVFLYEVHLRASPSLAGEGGELHLADEWLGWRLRPGAVVRHLSPGNFAVAYTIDAAGRRYHGAPVAAARRIHLFGDSFTFGHGVADRETYAALLQKRLGPAQAVLNYGVAGYGLEQMYLWLERNSAAIRPGDLVLWAPISGDLERSFIDPRFLCGLALSQTLPIGLAPVLGGQGFTTLAVAERCRWIDSFLGRSRLPLASLVNRLLDRRRQAAVLANAQRILARAAALATSHGARFRLIFVARPAECLNRAHVFDLSGLRQPYRTLLEACPADPASIQALRFPTDGHWTAAGHRWAAAALLPLIEGRDAPRASGQACPTCAR